MILVVVYVGAVAVLFLFVVMMLDVDFVELRQGMLNYLPVGVTIGLIVLVELALVVGSWAIGSGAWSRRALRPRPRTSPTPKRWAASSTRISSSTSRRRASCCWSP